MMARQGWVKAISVQGAGRGMRGKTRDSIGSKTVQGKKPSWRQGWESCCAELGGGEERKELAGWTEVSKGTPFADHQAQGLWL